MEQTAKKRITTMCINGKDIEIYEDDVFEFEYWHENGCVQPRLRDIFDADIEYRKLMKSVERTISILNLRNRIW